MVGLVLGTELGVFVGAELGLLVGAELGVFVGAELGLLVSKRACVAKMLLALLPPHHPMPRLQGVLHALIAVSLWRP